MRWVSETEEDVKIDDYTTVTYVTTHFECEKCPTTANVTHEMPAECIYYPCSDSETSPLLETDTDTEK